MPKPPPSSSPFWKLVNVGTALNVFAYRRSGGKLGGKLGKAPVLLLHHVGRKSGTPRVTPLLYLDDGERLVIVASKGGTDKNPAWYYNLMAMAATDVEVGRDRRHVRPRLAADEERAGYWPRLVAIYPAYEQYASYTSRTIPIVVLEPA